MEYRVTNECLPIFNVNGTMMKTQKSKIVESFHMQPTDPLPTEYIAILNMGFIWHLSTPSFEDRTRCDGTNFTWRDYATKMFSIITARHKDAAQSILVNDRYDLPFTIKGSDRNVCSSYPKDTKISSSDQTTRSHPLNHSKISCATRQTNYAYKNSFRLSLV